MKLVKCDSDIPILNEMWTVDFYDHKSLNFTTKEDLEKYLRHELSEEHGYMEYERVPSGVTHTINYKIDWDIEE
jgi:hypothetical protein